MTPAHCSLVTGLATIHQLRLGMVLSGAKSRERYHKLAEEAGRETVAKRQTAIVAKGPSALLLCARSSLDVPAVADPLGQLPFPAGDDE